MSRDRGAECRVESCSEEPVSSSGYCMAHLLDRVDNSDHQLDSADPGAVSDEMIGRASIPNAAALLRRATKRGFITPTSGYAAFAKS